MPACEAVASHPGPLRTQNSLFPPVPACHQQTGTAESSFCSMQPAHTYSGAVHHMCGSRRSPSRLAATDKGQTAGYNACTDECTSKTQHPAPADDTKSSTAAVRSAWLCMPQGVWYSAQSGLLAAIWCGKLHTKLCCKPLSLAVFCRKASCGCQQSTLAIFAALPHNPSMLKAAEPWQAPMCCGCFITSAHFRAYNSTINTSEA